MGVQGPFENPFITVAFLCFASDHILMVNILNLNQKPQIIIIIPIIIVINKDRVTPQNPHKQKTNTKSTQTENNTQ